MAGDFVGFCVMQSGRYRGAISKQLATVLRYLSPELLTLLLALP
jgi:hypothetical protein